VTLRYDRLRRYACSRPSISRLSRSSFSRLVDSVPQVSSLIRTIIRFMTEGPKKNQTQICFHVQQLRRIAGSAGERLLIQTILDSFGFCIHRGILAHIDGAKLDRDAQAIDQPGGWAPRTAKKDDYFCAQGSFRPCGHAVLLPGRGV
jgi:hypothetical protein